jgi:glycosyltransferase involved in cell wall biosynthesis
MLLSDEPLKQTLIARGRPSVVENFSWQTGARQIIQVYRSCLNWKRNQEAI